MTGIADTGFLVAFANRRDEFFPWAHALAESIHEPLLTCEAVLAETAFHLKDSARTHPGHHAPRALNSYAINREPDFINRKLPVVSP